MTGRAAHRPAIWHLARAFRARYAVVPLPDAVYRELIDMLFSMKLPIMCMGLVFTGVGALIAMKWGDPVIAVLTVGAAVVTVVRLLTISAYRRQIDSTARAAELRTWEQRYALGNYAFAILLATLNVRVLAYHMPILHMVAVSLIFGFGAGIVSRISIRPMICVTSLLIATVPTVTSLVLHSMSDVDMPLHTELFASEALLVAMITLLSLNTVQHLYKSAVRHLTAEHDLALLAKQDALTGLPNRLLLRERFQRSIVSVAHAQTRLALHFLDLDGFKAINDVHGHPAGDALLKEVSRRLTGMVRSNDTVARLGGDEFVVLQEGIGHEGEAEMLARRIIKQLSAPYQIDGKEMRISVSVGIALAPEQGLDLERLSGCADAALYRSKGGGRGQLHFCTPDDGASMAGAQA